MFPVSRSCGPCPQNSAFLRPLSPIVLAKNANVPFAPSSSGPNTSTPRGVITASFTHRIVGCLVLPLSARCRGCHSLRKCYLDEIQCFDLFPPACAHVIPPCSGSRRLTDRDPQWISFSDVTSRISHCIPERSPSSPRSNPPCPSSPRPTPPFPSPLLVGPCLVVSVLLGTLR